MAVAAVCPRCRSPLHALGEALQCSACSQLFPVVAGIPDLRVAADPWIEMAADRAKGIAVDAAAGPGFEAAVRTYWEQTPTTSTGDAGRHIGYTLRSLDRVGQWVAAIDPAVSAGGPTREQWLDLGCGTAELTCVAPSTVDVTSVDIAFRWLMVARRRVAECGRLAVLHAANAESLPFPDRSFDRVIALGMLEQCRDVDRVLKEVFRVLKPGGRLYLRSTNRYSLLPEPHVDVWGVGWMPRAWADRYVRWRRGVGYVHHWPRGVLELRRRLAGAGLTGISIHAAAMLPAERDRLSPRMARLHPWYERLRRTSPTAQLGAVIAPLLEGTASRPAATAETGASLR